jgi:cobalt-zinc-cadmium efflux system protein
LLGHDHHHDHDHDHDHHGHGHDHGHGHAHGEGHAHARGGEKKRLYAALFLTGTILVAEAVGGILSHSLALLSDAGHMLTDLSALLLTLFAMTFAMRPADHRRSYGFYRLEILAALANGLVLLALAGFIVYEAVGSFMHPHEVHTGLMLVIACVALVVNLIGASILHGAHSLNVRAAYLHVLADTLSSVAVIIGAIVMWIWPAATQVDPTISCLISLFIVFSALRLLRDAVNILLEAVPHGVDPARVESDIGKLPGVREVHDLHIWTITSGMFALSAHIVVESSPDSPCSLHDALISEVQRLLERDHRIMHSTLQIESQDHEHVSAIH